MIREFISSDMNTVLDIWLKASIKAHHFIDKDFWISKVKEMREVYIPLSRTYVYESENEVIAFFSLYKSTLAAIFVYPEQQGKGIGHVLIAKAQSLNGHLSLSVYTENKAAVSFYQRNGFSVTERRIDVHTGHEELVMANHDKVKVGKPFEY